jgi:dTDP-4-dehydrorhamnose reductase
VKVLVLGSSGFLGSYLGFALPKMGHQVVGASRRDIPYFPHNRVVKSLEDFTEIIKFGGYEAVVNCVAIASHEACEADPETAQLVNATFPGIWASAAEQVGAKFVHISTDAVFDGDSQQLYVEDYDKNPTSHYGISKSLGESLVIAAHRSALVVRTNFFGWSQNGKSGILDFFVTAAESKTPVTGFQDYSVSSIYVGNLVDLILGLLRNNAAGVIHLSSSTVLSKYDFGVMVSHEAGLSSENISPGFLADADGMAKRGSNLGLSTDKARLLLGSELPSTAEGVRRAFAERDTVRRYFNTLVE